MRKIKEALSEALRPSKVVGSSAKNIQINRRSSMEFTDLDQYLGIQEDPLGKTQEKYHVRMKEEYYLDDKSQLMTQYKLYFRVRDLAPVYFTENDFIPNKAISYTEWLDGGMVEFQGTFVKSDFHIPGCDYTTETHAFLE